jgi:hypothetical protein
MARGTKEKNDRRGCAELDEDLLTEGDRRRFEI